MLVICLLLVVAIGLAVTDLLARRLSLLVILLAAGVGLSGLTAFLNLMSGRTWWAVPGGLIYREHRLWRSQCKGGLITRHTSPLFLDSLSGFGAVLDGDRVLRFPVTHVNAFWVLSAWKSRLPPPTREAALAFVDAVDSDGRQRLSVSGPSPVPTPRTSGS